MKVHIQKRITVVIMCMAIIATTILSPMQAHAVKGAPYYSNDRVVDIALTKTGVVANKSINEYVTASIEMILRNSVYAYIDWLTEKSYTEATMDNYMEFIMYATEDTVGATVYKMITSDILDRRVIVELVNLNKDSIDSYLDLYYLNTGKDASEETNITLSNELVVYIREIFNEYIDTEADFVWVPTYKASDINIKWFANKANYDGLVNLVNNIDGYLHVRFYQNKGNKYFSMDEYNEYVADGIGYWYIEKGVNFGLIKSGETLESADYSISVIARSEDWGTFNVPAYVDRGIDDAKTITAEQLPNGNLKELYQASSKVGRYVNGYAHTWLFTNDGRKVKVFKNLDAYKNNTIGKDSYYVNDISDSYNTTDNSVTVSGDYITGSNYQYSHDVVQNEIDNSENVDNSVVNNIVNNNTSTIINNYANSVIPDSGNGGNGGSGDGDGGGGLGSILDGLGSIVGALADIVGFLLGIIGDIISLIGDLFKTVFEGIKAIGEIFAGFTGLLASLFPFIPEELITFLTLAIEATVGVAIWRQFKKG